MKNNVNPLNMIRDLFSRDNFVFPNTKCTDERVLFFKRVNEIFVLLYITKHAYEETEKLYKKRMPLLPNKENTPLKLGLNAVQSIVFPVKKIIQISREGSDVLTRQSFVMFYGSFETYLFQLFERSFKYEKKEYSQDELVNILMRKKWDSKFNGMNEIFSLSFKAGALIRFFSGFKLNFEGKVYTNPLNYLDELASVRHRIVHASSIIEKDELVKIDMNIFHELYGFYFLLTDFVDSLFGNKFGYLRKDVNPAKA